MHIQCFIHMPGVYVCNPFMWMSMTSMHVYMPAVKLYK